MLEVIDGRDRQSPVHVARPSIPATDGSPQDAVATIVQDVRARGDAAVVEYTRKFDCRSFEAGNLRVDPAVIEKAGHLVPPELIGALEAMAARLRRTCKRQRAFSWTDDTGDEFVGELIRPLRRAGVYVPGGRAAYPSSVIMATVPAAVAGVGGIAVCSPPGGDGEIAESVLAACAVAGVTEVYRMGGAHGVAALAYGTESVRPVDKIVGPGNIYVTLAKRLVQGWVGIDSEAGPTEIVVIADDSADPHVIAEDLVAQAEHGPHGSHVLITWIPEVVDRVLAALELAVARHERPDDVDNALIEGGRAVIVRDKRHALETANAFASEHLQLSFAGATESLDGVLNAGSVFVGIDSPVPVGDYAGGTNHVLPTGGSARWSSGLGVHDFVKRIYVSGFQPSALERLAPHVDSLAHAEGLNAHARAVRARLDARRV